MILNFLSPSPNYCPHRDFPKKAKFRGGALVTRAYIKEITYIKILKYTVSMPEKNSICLNRGREESGGNDDVSIVCAHKYELVRMTLRQKISKGRLRLIFWHLLYSHTSILFCLTCYQWHSVEQLFWKLWTKRHSISTDEVIRCI